MPPEQFQVINTIMWFWTSGYIWYRFGSITFSSLSALTLSLLINFNYFLQMVNCSDFHSYSSCLFCPCLKKYPCLSYINLFYNTNHIYLFNFQHILLTNLNSHTALIHELNNENYKANITAIKLDYNFESPNPDKVRLNSIQCMVVITPPINR